MIFLTSKIDYIVLLSFRKLLKILMVCMRSMPDYGHKNTDFIYTIAAITQYTGIMPSNCSEI